MVLAILSLCYAKEKFIPNSNNLPKWLRLITGFWFIDFFFQREVKEINIIFNKTSKYFTEFIFLFCWIKDNILNYFFITDSIALQRIDVIDKINWSQIATGSLTKFLIMGTKEKMNYEN